MEPGASAGVVAMAGGLHRIDQFRPRRAGGTALAPVVGPCGRARVLRSKASMSGTGLESWSQAAGIATALVATATLIVL